MAVKAVDSVTVYNVSDGQSAIYVVLSNENATVPCDSSGNPTSLDNTSTTISVYEGSQELVYTDTEPTESSTWTVNIESTGCESPEPVKTESEVTLENITAIYTDSAVRTVTITGIDSNGNEFTRTATQSLVKVKSGNGDTTPPTIPSIVSTSVSEEANVTINFNGSTDEGTGVAYYQIYRKDSDKFILIGRVDSVVNVSTYSYLDITAPKNVSVYYQISAYDKAGNVSEMSSSVNVTTTVTAKPNKPKNVSSKAFENKITIKWEPELSSNAIKNPESFIVEAKTSEDSEWIQIATTGSSSFDYTITGYKEKSDIEVMSFRVKSKSIYEVESDYEISSAVNVSEYKTYVITYPDVTAIAYKEGIRINISNNENDYYLTPIYTIKYGEDEIYSGVYKEELLITYSGYPTASDIGSKEIYINVKTSANEKSGNKLIDTTKFKGWIPAIPSSTSTPKIYNSNNGRTISLSWDSQDIYDFLGCEIQVAKGYEVIDDEYKVITDDSKLIWYAPALGINPYEDEDNYKVGNIDGYLSVKGTSVVFSLPLFGQNDNAPVNTMYAYRFRAYSEGGKSEWSSVVWIEAKATSAMDVVKAWKLSDTGEKVKIDGSLGAAQIFVEELAALSANLGYINDGALRGDSYNYWAVGDVELPDGSMLYKGSFRVGGENQYIKVTPKIEEGVATGEYDVDFVVNDVTISSAGTKVEGKSFSVYDNDGNLMFQTAPEGNKIRVKEGSYRSYDPTISYLGRSPIRGFGCSSFIYNSHYYRLQNTEGKLCILKDNIIIYTASSYYPSSMLPLLNQISGVIKVPLYKDSSSYTILTINLTTDTFTTNILSYSDVGDTEFAAICGDIAYLISGGFLNLTTGEFTSSTIGGIELYPISFFYNNYFYTQKLTSTYISIIKVDFYTKKTSVCMPRIAGKITSEAKSIFRGSSEGIHISYPEMYYFSDPSTKVTDMGVAFIKWEDMKWANSLDELTEESKFYFYKGRISTYGYSIGYMTDFIYISIEENTDTSTYYIGGREVYKLDINNYEQPISVEGGVIAGTIGINTTLFNISDYFKNYCVAPSIYEMSVNEETSYYFSIPTYENVTNEIADWYNFKFYTLPFEKELTSKTYGAGIGFVSILYDVDSENYKYKLDTGAYLEFNKSGQLVSRGQQGFPGPQGEQGEKGDKGDVGAPFKISKTYSSVASLLADFSTTTVGLYEFAAIDTGNVEDPDNAKLYMKGETEWRYITDLSGSQGIQGPQGIQGEQGDKGDKGDKGETGAAAGFGTCSATVDNNTGTPSVTVTTSGPDTEKIFNFAFKNIKGIKGDKGDIGSVIDYANFDGTGSASAKTHSEMPDTKSGAYYPYWFPNITPKKNDITLIHTSDDYICVYIATSDIHDGYSIGVIKIGEYDTKFDDPNKMDKTNPTGTGSFSLNRLSNSTIGDKSFAEGYNTTASGQYSHAEGQDSIANGPCSHAEGVQTTASGIGSHAEGIYTIAASDGMHAAGMYNKTSTGLARVTGWGTASGPKDIEKLDTSGNLEIAGKLTAKGTILGSNFETTGDLTAVGTVSGSNLNTTSAKLNGGTEITKTTNATSFYAPTGAGTSGQFVKSSGSGAPSWYYPYVPLVTISGGWQTRSLTATLTGFTLTTGVEVDVLFSDGYSIYNGTFSAGVKTSNSPTTNYPTLNINSTGAKPIKVGQYYAGENFVQKGEIHRFKYDGSAWQDLTTQVVYQSYCNRESADYVCAPASSTSAPTKTAINNTYVKYRNGLIEQWATSEQTFGNFKTINLAVKYLTTDYNLLSLNYNSGTTSDYFIYGYKNLTYSSFQIIYDGDKYDAPQIKWHTQGY